MNETEVPTVWPKVIKVDGLWETICTADGLKAEVMLLSFPILLIPLVSYRSLVGLNRVKPAECANELLLMFFQWSKYNTFS